MTIKEIAKLCDVSVSTVSNVINGKNKAGSDTAKRVLKVIEENGYKPSYIAKGLRTKSTNMIGIIVEDIILFNIHNIINGIMECCEQNGYTIILENMRLYARKNGTWFQDKKKYQLELESALTKMDEINVDGIIYVAGHERIISKYERELRVPMVMAYSFSQTNNISSVVIDDEQGGYDMTKYLLSKGHRKVGVIGGECNNLHSFLRLKGYKRALSEEQILFDPLLVESGGWEREVGYSIVADIIARGATAVFCMSDMIAAGVYDYLNENNIEISKDISVVGYDNQILAEYLIPTLTTMELPLDSIGFQAAQKLIGIIKGEEVNNNEELKVRCTLIERDSVGVI